MPECGQVERQSEVAAKGQTDKCLACSYEEPGESGLLAAPGQRYQFITSLLGSAHPYKLTSIAGSERHRRSQGFRREAKLLPILPVEAIAPLALLVATADC